MKKTDVVGDVGKEVLNEFLQSCNLREKIVVKMFCKIFVKFYNVERMKLFNIFLN